jgi:hypothetical protein
MRKRLYALAALCCAILVVGAARSQAQLVTGTIVGTAFDPSGARVPGATVTLTNMNTQATRSTNTDAGGNYVFTELPPAVYRVTAEAHGFRTTVISNIRLQVSQGTRADVHFRLGTTSQQVSVTAPVALLDTQTSSQGMVITGNTIQNLPLNGRDFLQLATLAPGVLSGSGDVNTLGRGLTGLDISGGRPDQDSYLIDGVETRMLQLNNESILLSPDAIQEFKLLENNFDARYGQSSEIVSVATKTGTNAFHGSAYEFIRNNSLDATPFFDNYFNTTLPSYEQNQFGASAGGPILHNKLFFFANYEGLRIRQGNLESGIVPTTAELSGDLSTSTTPVIDPFTGQAFPGNIIPSSMISKAATVFNTYIPAPNTSSATGINYITSPSTQRNDDQFTARLDANLSSKDVLSGEEVWYNSSLFTPGLASLYGYTEPYRGQVFALHETHSISPTAVNVATLAYNRAVGLVSWQITPSDINTAMGVSNLPNIPSLYGLPDMDIIGCCDLGGYPFEGGGIQNVYQVDDELSWTRGRHDLSFGGNVWRFQFQFPAASFANGIYEFFGTYSGNAIGDYLLGVPFASVAQQIPDYSNFRQTQLALYAQDNFRVTPRLTLNLGVRYEYDQPEYEINGKEGYFNRNEQKIVVRVPSTYSNLPIPASDISYDPSFQQGIWNPEYLNFAPRVGFAYEVTHSTVLRGGYGIFYTQTEGNQLQGKADMLPLAYTATVEGSVTNPPTYTMSTLFPSLTTQAVNGDLSTFTVDPNDKRPNVQEWNLGVEHRFGSSLMAGVSYVGSKGTYLVERVDANQAVLPPSPTDITPIQSRRPLPNWGDIEDFGYGENSNYNALQAELQKRLSNGLSFMASYTWMHSLDTSTASDTGFATSHQNTYDLEADYASSDFEVPQTLTLSYTYQLPFGSGKAFLSGISPELNKLVGGWQLLGITTFDNGGVGGVTVEGDRADTDPGYAYNRADMTPGCTNNGNIPGGGTIQRWFNTSCFVVTPLGTYGDIGRNIIRTPGVDSWDMSLFKVTSLTERLSTEFRVEAFGIWNNPQFDAPTLDVQSPTFGEITDSGGDREIQLALKFLW